MGISITPPTSGEAPTPDRIPPRLKPGDALPASYPNSWGDLLRMLGMTLGKNLRMKPGSGGVVLDADLRECRPFYVRIASVYSAADGGYAWSRVVRGGGGWSPVGVSGTAADDPAIEANGNEDVQPNAVVLAHRVSGELVFQLNPCQ